MESRFGKANRVWVMHRGMVSAQNIAGLNETRRRYVIGTGRAELRRWSKQLPEKNDWRHIREDVEVKIRFPHPESDLCIRPVWQH